MVKCSGLCDGCSVMSTLYPAVAGDYHYWNIEEVFLCLQCCAVVHDKLNSTGKSDMLSIRLRRTGRELLVHDVVFQEEVRKIIQLKEEDSEI